MIQAVIDYERTVRAALDRLPPPDVCRAIREHAGFSQRKAGAAIPVSATTIGLWEDGRHRPRGPHLVAYVELLDQLRELGPAS